MNISGIGSVNIAATVAMLDCLGLYINSAVKVTPIKYLSEETYVFVWVVLKCPKPAGFTAPKQAFRNYRAPGFERFGVCSDSTSQNPIL